MAKALTVISKNDVEKIWKLRQELSQRTQEYNEAEYAFIREMYSFAEKYRGSEDALNAELNRRNISIREKQYAYFTKVAKLALAQEVVDGETGETEWVLEEGLAPEISRYAVIMAGADKTGIPATAINDKLLELGKDRMIGEMRKALSGGGGGGEKQLDYLALLSDGVADGAGDLLTQTYTIDREKLGLPVGKIELVGEVDENGKLQIRAIFPVDDTELNERLEKIYARLKPLDREHGELFREILRLSSVLPKGAKVSIKSDETGVEVNLVADDEEGRTYLATIKSPQFDPSYGENLSCHVSVEDIKRWTKLPSAYGNYATSTLSSQNGCLVVTVLPKGVRSLDEAVEMENAGKDISKTSGQPKWIVSAELVKSEESKDEYRKALFEAPEIPQLVSLHRKNAKTIELTKTFAKDIAKQARASTDQAVNIVESELVFGDGGKSLDNLRLAKALTQLKSFAAKTLNVLLLTDGVLIDAAKRDYVWSIYLPTIK